MTEKIQVRMKGFAAAALVIGDLLGYRHKIAILHVFSCTSNKLVLGLLLTAHQEGKLVLYSSSIQASVCQPRYVTWIFVC